MWKKIQLVLLPFHRIAEELAALRKLYEYELMSRNPPIIMPTEKPKADDTEVIWGDGKAESGKLRKLMENWRAQPDEEEEE